MSSFDIQGCEKFLTLCPRLAIIEMERRFYDA